MKYIGYIASTIAIIVYSTVMNGWALSKLWSWFVVETFGLPILSIPEAIGLAMIASYLTHQTDLGKNRSDKSFGEILVEGAMFATARPLVAVGGGAILKAWMA